MNCLDILSVDRAFFEKSQMQQAAAEAIQLRENPPALMQICYDVAGKITDANTNSGYIVLSPLTQMAPEALRVETPAIYRTIDRLTRMPTVHGRIKHKLLFPVINFAPPGGEVSRHQDAGANTHRWIGRCVTLQGRGDISYFELDSDQVIAQEVVSEGDVTTHLNPANGRERIPHKVETLGQEERISMGLLLALKNERFYHRQRTA